MKGDLAVGIRYDGSHFQRYESIEHYTQGFALGWYELPFQGNIQRMRNWVRAYF